MRMSVIVIKNQYGKDAAHLFVEHGRYAPGSVQISKQVRKKFLIFSVLLKRTWLAPFSRRRGASGVSQSMFCAAEAGLACKPIRGARSGGRG